MVEVDASLLRVVVIDPLNEKSLGFLYLRPNAPENPLYIQRRGGGLGLDASPIVAAPTLDVILLRGIR